VTFEVEKTMPRDAGDDAEAVATTLSTLAAAGLSGQRKAIEACRQVHADEWAIRDSFAELQKDQPHRCSRTLSSRSSAIAPGGRPLVGRRRQEQPHDDAYTRLPAADLADDAAAVLAHFARWWSGRRSQRGAGLLPSPGRQRRAAGVELHEFLSALMLLRRRSGPCARSGRVGAPIDVYRVLELDRRLVLFFDRALFHAAADTRRNPPGERRARGARPGRHAGRVRWLAEVSAARRKPWFFRPGVAACHRVPIRNNVQDRPCNGSSDVPPGGAKPLQSGGYAEPRLRQT